MEEPIAIQTLHLVAEEAWRRLRFEFPELTATAKYLQDEPYMICEIPKDDHAVDAWVFRTLFIEKGSHKLGHSAMRGKLTPKKVGLDSETSFLVIRGVTKDGINGDDEQMSFKCIEFMLNVDHQVTDGIGVRLLLNLYLDLFRLSLSDKSEKQPKNELDWGASAENLATPWVAVMDEGQILSGEEYIKLVEANRDFMFNKLVSRKFRSLGQSYTSEMKYS